MLLLFKDIQEFYGKNLHFIAINWLKIQTAWKDFPSCNKMISLLV